MAKHHSNPTKAPSQRQLRVGELVRHRLSELLARGEVHDSVLATTPITVSEVRMSPDLKHATAFVMPLGGQNTPQVLEALTEHRVQLRRQVASGLHLKYAPELRFLADESFDRMDRTRALLESDAVRRDLGREDNDPDGQEG